MPVFVSDTNEIDGAPSDPFANLIGAVIDDCPSVVTTDERPVAMSDKSEFIADDEIGVRVTKAGCARTNVPLPLYGMVSSYLFCC